MFHTHAAQIFSRLIPRIYVMHVCMYVNSIIFCPHTITRAAFSWNLQFFFLHPLHHVNSCSVVFLLVFSLLDLPLSICYSFKCPIRSSSVSDVRWWRFLNFNHISAVATRLPIRKNSSKYSNQPFIYPPQRKKPHTQNFLHFRKYSKYSSLTFSVVCPLFLTTI